MKSPCLFFAGFFLASSISFTAENAPDFGDRISGITRDTPEIRDSAAELRSPADWVKRLGADHLVERDEASSALLELGPKARKEVLEALDSPDAEVQARARELWRTLRWEVVPGAGADVLKLVAEWKRRGTIQSGHWRDFVQGHGVESIRLVSEFCAEKAPASMCEDGMYSILERVAPGDVAQLIARSYPFPPVLEKTLDHVVPGHTFQNTAANYMQFEIALSHFKKAFDFGHEAYYWTDDDEVCRQCGIAAARGKLSDDVDKAARGDISGETNEGRLRTKLKLFATVLSALGRKDEIAALFDLAPGLDTSQLNANGLKPFIENLSKAGGPACVVRALRRARTAPEFYMRSCAEMQMHDPASAEADWRASMAALDAVKKDKKETILELVDLMYMWHDNRAESVVQKALDVTPPDSEEDSIAWIYFGGFAEEAHRYARAADCYEKGLALAIDAGIEARITLSDGPGEREDASGEEAMRGRIKKMRAQAAAQDAASPTPPPPPDAVPAVPTHP